MLSSFREADLLSLAGSMVSDVDTLHLGGFSDIGNLDDCKYNTIVVLNF